jgi:hypothetical protein
VSSRTSFVKLVSLKTQSLPNSGKQAETSNWRKRAINRLLTPDPVSVPVSRSKVKWVITPVISNRTLVTQLTSASCRCWCNGLISPATNRES